MDSVLHTTGRFGPRTLLITAAALPLTGWAVHAVALQIAAKEKDPLTGLLRRDAYTARARRLLARREDVAVVMVDQDHFKAVNDDFGHPAGDAVLAATAARLTAWAGPRAAIGRLGGDEFAVVLELKADRRAQRLEQLVRMLHTPVTLDDGRTVDVGASVGAATPYAVGSRDLSLLQRAADAALYDGKDSGRAVLATAQHVTVPSINGPPGRPSGHGRVGAGRMSTATLSEGDWIRGISIRQPYAACILAGAKDVENRPGRWRTGWVLLHTSKTIDQPALRAPLIGRTIRDRELVTGAVVGIARITDCHQDPEGAPLCSQWAHPGS